MDAAEQDDVVDTAEVPADREKTPSVSVGLVEEEVTTKVLAPDTSTAPNSTAEDDAPNAQTTPPRRRT